MESFIINHGSWLLSLSVIILRLIHVVGVYQESSPCSSVWCPIVRLDCNVFNFSPIDGLLVCFQFGDIMNKSSMNIYVLYVDMFSSILSKYLGVEFTDDEELKEVWSRPRSYRQKGTYLD